MHVIAAKAVALKEALSPDSKSTSSRSSKTLRPWRSRLMSKGFRLTSDGTDNHLMLVDLRKSELTGKVAQETLDKARITVNRNAVPFDTRSPFVTSGIRIGTPAVTTRGMKEDEMDCDRRLDRPGVEPCGDETVLSAVADEVGGAVQEISRLSASFRLSIGGSRIDDREWKAITDCSILYLPSSIFELIRMKCPFCHETENRVIDSRLSKDSNMIRRRRECERCNRRFTTYERVEEMMPLVVKKDGRREGYDRVKIINGLSAPAKSGRSASIPSKRSPTGSSARFRSAAKRKSPARLSAKRSCASCTTPIRWLTSVSLRCTVRSKTSASSWSSSRN